MKRRDFLKMASCGAVAAAVSGFSECASAGSDGGQKLPNFVVIFIDDMGYGDIEPFGSKVNRTPNLNRMAAEGMKLTSFYAAPLCTPSRAQILTGCYAKRVSLPKVIFPICAIGLNPKEKTVATLLKEQGYATMCIGKWHVGDQPEFLPTKHGFDHYVGLPYSNDMKPLPLLRDEKVIKKSPDQDNIEKLYTEEAVKFIKSNKDKPFFLYFPHTAVHVPLHPGKEFAGKSKNGRFGDWVEEVDWSVGQVLDTLRELKLDSNTLVLFTSDNGPWLKQKKDAGTAAPLRGGKKSTWEGGMREPTIAWWPGRIKAKSVSDGIVSEMDVLPTLVGLAGGKVPTDRKIDGVDVWPLLSGQITESPRKVLFYFAENKVEGVRVGKWKLTEAGKKKQELYNLDEDIGESKDVASANPGVVKQLRDVIAEMDKDLGIDGTGPGVREPGRVANPKGLFMSRKEYD